MAELVGGPLLSGLYNILLDRLASKDVIEFFRGNKKAVAELLYELNVRLGSAHKLVNDAEEKQLKDRDVKNWLDGLKEVMDEASHVLDKINTEAMERRIEEEGCENSMRKASKLLARSFIPNALFENNVKGDLAEILCKLKTLLDQTNFLGLKERDGAKVLSEGLLLPLTPLVEEIDVCGRKAEKEALVKQLLSDDGNDGQKMTVIPIVGMGGIGKTTLARLVYNDKDVREHFELKAWVIVSVSFDVPRIAKTILDAVVGGQANIEDPNRLQTNLKNVLRGKKFLFVLDDVWSESYESWDILRSCFESGGRGSKVVVTTRSKIVASVMRNVPDYDLQTISQDDCWSLFAKHVGFHNESNSDLLEIGAKIVKKCKGLPLAVKSIAGLLRSVMCPNEWSRILENDTWESQNTSVIPALWLSYKFLPPHLKRCFAYFSIFPKDYEFKECDKDKIILLWMAEGLLQEEKGNSRPMEEIGREYLNALISRSFFQRSSRNESTLLMHDLLHDLAHYVSGDSSFVLESYNNKDESNKINDKTRHVLYWKTSEDHSMGFESLSEAKYLRTLLALPLSLSAYLSCPLVSRPIEKVMYEVLMAKEQLRVLSLSGNSSLASLPDIFGNLKYLRYLDLSWTKLEQLPNSICMLYNLQTLLLSNCSRLTQLPANSCNIINLRHLDVRGTALKDMPPNIHLLKNLRMLSDFVIGKDDSERTRTEELGELRLLHGSLMVSGLENIADSSHISQAGLVDKYLLTELIVSWEGETDDSAKEREVLSELRPNAKLKELKVMGFMGTTFPHWVGHQSFSNMVSVSLIKCANCCLLPPLGQLPSLKSLTIEGMNCVISIGDEFCGNSSNFKPFSSLETLTIDGMDSLIDWSFSKIDQDIGLFPRLKILNLEFCRKLNFGLPAGCFPSLKGIRITSCRSMKAVFPNSAQVSVDLAYPSLEAVEVRRCPRMELFSEMGLPRNDNLKRLEIHDECELLFANRVNWDLPRLSSLKRLELSGCRKVVDSFPEEGLLPLSLERLRIDSFRSLRRLSGRGFRHLTCLRQLSIIECKQLKCLPEEGLPNSLSFLCIARCPSLTLRCQRDVGEDWPKIKHIPIIIIDRERI